MMATLLAGNNLITRMGKNELEPGVVEARHAFTAVKKLATS